jgi:hypothetical protein
MNIVNDILGWGLMLLGLFLIFTMFNCAGNSQILLAIALSIPSTVVFRAGVGFLRMNSAHRLAKQKTNDHPSSR